MRLRFWDICYVIGGCLIIVGSGIGILTYEPGYYPGLIPALFFTGGGILVWIVGIVAWSISTGLSIKELKEKELKR